LQDLLGLEDEPAQQLFIELRQRHYPAPLGQDSRGTPEGIESLDAAIVRAHYQKLFRPNGIILSVAGNIEWRSLLEQVGQLFSDWKPGPEPALTLGTPTRATPIWRRRRPRRRSASLTSRCRSAIPTHSTQSAR